jgi:hypothetical protein
MGVEGSEASRENPAPRINDTLGLGMLPTSFLTMASNHRLEFSSDYKGQHWCQISSEKSQGAIRDRETSTATAQLFISRPFFWGQFQSP